jgi:hypothetical protein
MRHFFSGVATLAMLASALPGQTATPPNRAAAAATQAGAMVRRPLDTKDIVAAKTERVADRTTFELTAKMDVAPKLKLFDWTGKEVAVTRTPNGVIKADVDPKRGYVLARPIADRASLGKAGAEFPARYVTFTAAGKPTLGGLFLRPVMAPLTWSDEAKAYATELLVGYEFDDGREAPLASPKTVTFFRTASRSIKVESPATSAWNSGPDRWKGKRISRREPERRTN